MNSKAVTGLVVAGIVAVVLLVVSLFVLKIAVVHGNEMGVKETWTEGVEDKAYPAKTYFLFPGWSQSMYNYDMSSQVFTMNDTPTHHEPSYKGRETDAYLVNSSEGQEMVISLNVRWRRDPAHLVEMHKTIRNDVEEKLIRPAVQRIVKNEGTVRKAIDAFSGEGLVKLQNAISNDLTNPEGELAKRGVIVENFVIEKIRLDEKYIGEIRARQVASQQKLRADEETKAAEALALKAKAEAGGDYNRRVVEAERDKAVGILKAEEDKQKKVLAAQGEAERLVVTAEADKKQVVLAAEGEQQAGLLKAQAIEAIGKAEAEATKLKLSAYAVPGADAFVRVEVSKQVAQAYGGIKGYLPGDMKVNLLTESFVKSVEQLVGGGKEAPKK